MEAGTGKEEREREREREREGEREGEEQGARQEKKDANDLLPSLPAKSKNKKKKKVSLMEAYEMQKQQALDARALRQQVHWYKSTCFTGTKVQILTQQFGEHSDASGWNRSVRQQSSSAGKPLLSLD